jgi:RNA polymerase sigma-70 factor (ECF subfamily)
MNRSTEVIWSEFGQQLLSFIRYQVKDNSIADDILQEVFIKILFNIDSLSDQSKLRSWIYQIARNQIFDYYRKDKSDYLSSDTLPDLNEESPADFMQKVVEDMISMMNELPPEYCQSLCMTEIAGLNQKTYAEKVGISYSGAKSRI